MTLAIVTITRNDLAGLQRTLASIECQTTQPDEHWIIDGASTDGTREYLASLQPHQNRHVISEPDAGIYDAMNKGVARATADFVWFLNSGDCAADHGAVTRITNGLRETPDADGIYARIWFESRYGRRSQGRPVTARDFRFRMPVGHPGLVYRRALLVQNPFRTDLRIISDLILTRHLFESGARFVYQSIPHIAIFDLGGVSSRSHFLILREQLKTETHLIGKLTVTLIVGGKACALWLSHRCGAHGIYKRWQHRTRR